MTIYQRRQNLEHLTQTEVREFINSRVWQTMRQWLVENNNQCIKDAMYSKHPSARMSLLDEAKGYMNVLQLEQEIIKGVNHG